MSNSFLNLVVKVSEMVNNGSMTKVQGADIIFENMNRTLPKYTEVCSEMRDINDSLTDSVLSKIQDVKDGDFLWYPAFHIGNSGMSVQAIKDFRERNKILCEDWL